MTLGSTTTARIRLTHDPAGAVQSYSPRDPDWDEPMWGVFDARSGNAITWTTSKRQLNEWLSEIKAGDWGDVGVLHFDADGMCDGRLWPPEES